MSRKLLQLVIGATSVMLLLVGCGGIVPTPLPSGLEKVAIGTDFNNEKDCEITKPLTVPVKFPAGTTHFAVQVVFDPAKVTSLTISFREAYLKGTPYKNCDKKFFVAGAPRESWGTAVGSLKGDALEPGSYTIRITVNGQTIEVPFEIDAAH
jgi:hypothetical protein